MPTTTQVTASWRRAALVSGFVAVVVLSLGWMVQENAMLSTGTETLTQQALILALTTENFSVLEPTDSSMPTPSLSLTPNTTTQESTSTVSDTANANSTSDWPSHLPDPASPEPATPFQPSTLTPNTNIQEPTSSSVLGDTDANSTTNWPHRLPDSPPPEPVASPSELTTRPPMTTSHTIVTRKDCVKLSHREPRYEKINQRLCLSRSEVQAILQGIVFATAELFESHKVAYFLESGTLLGSYRDKGLIPHDNDADFGITMEGLAYLQKTPVQAPEGYEFTVWNSRLYPLSSRDDKLPARLIHKESGLYADVFAFQDWGLNSQGQRLIGPLPSVCFLNCVSCRIVSSSARHLQIPYDWVFPLAECPFEGRTLKCPREAAKYLRHMYGASFMHPMQYGHI